MMGFLRRSVLAVSAIVSLSAIAALPRSVITRSLRGKIITAIIVADNNDLLFLLRSFLCALLPCRCCLYLCIFFLHGSCFLFFCFSCICSKALSHECHGILLQCTLRCFGFYSLFLQKCKDLLALLLQFFC